MQIRFVDNQMETVGELLATELKLAQTTRIAVAFVSKGGLKSLEESILSSLSSGGKTEVLVGLDFATTEPEALQTMFGWTNEFEKFRFYVLPPSGSAKYHPKMYLMSGKGVGITLVGSSNLTEAGLFRNAEANIFIRSDETAEVFSDAQESFLRLKFDNRRIPDEELISEYAEAAKRIFNASRTFNASQLKTLQTPVEEKANSLPGPKPAPSELVGWLKLVYEALPEGEFTNEEVYKHEEEFQAKYPENQNVRQKVRQQLQYLRDMGLLEHLSRGNWRKV